jgi:glucose/arabinose dehydrogenase
VIPLFRRHLLIAAAIASLGLAQANAADIPHSSAPPVDPIVPGGICGRDVPAFKVAPGYKVDVVVPTISESRFLQFDNFGTLYVSSPRHGTITSFKLQPDGSYTKIADVVKVDPRRISGLHGMEFADGWLWFTTSHGVSKGKVVEDGSKLDDVTVVLPEGSIPGGGGHWYRPILVAADGFYTGVGDHDNFSDLNNTRILAQQEESEPHAFERQKIWKYSLDGKTKTLFSAGNRNTEKLQFRPGTDEVWGLDHGSDDFGKLLGDQIGKNQPITDNIPGEEVNHYMQGKFYGHPFLADNNLIRPEFADLDKNTDIVPNPIPPEYPHIKQIQANAVPPEFMFPAHFADNGWTFINKDSGLGKRGDMYVTSHGSWDSDLKVGYCVSHLDFDAKGKPTHATKIVDCLVGDEVGRTDRGGFLGRPVDIVEEPNTDNLIFSVDAPQSRIYRLSKVAAK